MYFIRRISLFIFIFLTFSQPSFVMSEPNLRIILALYDSTEEFNNQEDRNFIHNNAAMVLNYLGMKVIYHDVNKGLPSEELMSQTYGILSWFRDEKMLNAREYCQWLIKQIHKKRKVVILGNLGMYKDSVTGEDTPMKVIVELFDSLGLDYKGNWTDNPLEPTHKLKLTNKI